MTTNTISEEGVIIAKEKTLNAEAQEKKGWGGGVFFYVP